MDQGGRRVVCAGGAVVDRKFHLLVPSVPGTSNPAGVSTSSGGVARNVAENLAGLLPSPSSSPWAGPSSSQSIGPDVLVELVTAIGDDDAGATLLRHLSGRGVGVRHVRVCSGAATAQYVAVLEPDGDLAIGLAAMDVLDRVDRAALDRAWPTGGWLFCDANLSGPVLAHAVRRARVEGTPLVVDAVSTPKVIRLPADLTGITLLSCNRDEARAWLAENGRRATGSDPELAARIQAAGAAAVLLTRGADGVVVADRDGCQELPAEVATVVDVTGAGDALVAGTLAALIAQDLAGTPPDLAEAARSGIRLAAATVASPDSVLPDPAATPNH